MAITAITYQLPDGLPLGVSTPSGWHTIPAGAVDVAAYGVVDPLDRRAESFGCEIGFRFLIDGNIVTGSGSVGMGRAIADPDTGEFPQSGGKVDENGVGNEAFLPDGVGVNFRFDPRGSTAPTVELPQKFRNAGLQLAGQKVSVILTPTASPQATGLQVAAVLVARDQAGNELNWT